MNSSAREKFSQLAATLLKSAELSDLTELAYPHEGQAVISWAEGRQLPSFDYQVRKIARHLTDNGSSISAEDLLALWNAALQEELHELSPRDRFARTLSRLVHRPGTAAGHLAHQIGVSASTLSAWTVGRSVPRSSKAIRTLESIFIADGVRISRGELSRLWEEAAATPRKNEPSSQPEPKSGRYDLFVSYSTPDRKIVEDLVVQLGRRKVRVWWDAWEMRPGDTLRERISSGIDEARFMIVVLSPSSLQSRWVRYELNSAMVHEIESMDTKVIPAITPGVKIEQLPTDLRAKKAVDLRTRKATNESIESIVRMIRPDVFERQDLLRKLSQPAETHAETEIRRNILAEWGTDQALQNAAIRGLSRTPDHNALVVIVERALGEALFSTLYASFRALASRDDGGLLGLTATLLNDPRFLFDKVRLVVHKIATRGMGAPTSEVIKLTATTPGNFIDSNSAERDRAVEIIHKLKQIGSDDVRHGCALAVNYRRGWTTGLKFDVDDNAVVAAKDYARYRFPRLIDVLEARSKK